VTIEDRNLRAGQKLVATYKKQDHTCTVKATKDGLRYVLEDGSEFKSPSSAGSAVMGGSACNGWRFWTPASEAKKQATSKAEAKKTAAKTKAGATFEPMPDQKGATTGQVRYFCSACMDAFEAPAGVTPVGCPRGHKPGEEA
jgi:hypothetical protein